VIRDALELYRFARGLGENRPVALWYALHAFTAKWGAV